MKIKKKIFKDCSNILILYFFIFCFIIIFVCPVVLGFDNQLGMPNFGDNQLNNQPITSDSQMNVLASKDTVPPEIEIILPDGSTLAYQENINLNFTYLTDTPLDTCKFTLEGDDVGLFINNRTIIGCTNTTFNVSNDDYFTLTFYINDTFGNANMDSVDFRVSSVAPATNVDSPENNTWFDDGENIYFNFTSTDYDGIDQCDLYSNFTGIWKINETFKFVISGVQESIQKNLSESGFIFNIKCNDTIGSSTFANTNANYTVYVDETIPNATIITVNNSEVSGINFALKYNITDDRQIDNCSFTLRDLNDNIVVYGSNSSLNCSAITKTLSTVSGGTYKVKIWGMDKAGNTDFDEIWFSTTTPAGVPGGGGGLIIIGENETMWTMETETGTGIYQLDMLQGQKRSKRILFENLGVNERRIDLVCENSTGTKNLCQYVSFENTTIILEPKRDVKVSVFFTIDLPKDIEREFYTFNIAGVDNLGRKGIITVEVNLKINVFWRLFIKIGSGSLEIFGLSVRYFIVLAFLMFICSLLTYYSTKKTDIKYPKAISFIAGIFISLIIVSLPFV